MSGAAGNIVATLKAKIKETADELEKYEGMCEENRWEQWLDISKIINNVNHEINIAACRVRYREEQKAAEEIDTEVLSLNRKIKLLEDNIKRNEDRSGSDSFLTQK